LKSKLLLDDWKDNLLTVNDLLDVNIRRDNSPFLVYLSACGTGRIKNEDIRDDNLHLISGCQLAGFSHVIGTLWEVNDEFCVEV
jgi:CHAT domain-containing protein